MVLVHGIVREGKHTIEDWKSNEVYNEVCYKLVESIISLVLDVNTIFISCDLVRREIQPATDVVAQGPVLERDCKISCLGKNIEVRIKVYTSIEKSSFYR